MNNPSPNSPEPKLVPRFALQEANFRQYEPFFLRALKEYQFYVKQTDFPGRINSPKSFIHNFSEAKRGFLLYKYKTKPELENYPIRRLQAKEMSDGSVLIENWLLSPEHAV